MSWKNGIEFKPNWDVFFLTQAYIISQRSIDNRTCHGACWVSEDRRILSVGYNGPIKNSQDKYLSDFFDTKDKYGIMIHAEENALLNYHGSKSDIENSTMYITGKPCHKCLRMMIQKGIYNIVHGNVKSSCIDDYDNKMSRLILNDQIKVSIKEYNDVDSIIQLLDKTKKYIEYKND